MFPWLTIEDSKHDGEMKHGQDFEKSCGSPAPTKSLSAGKTEESIAIWDISFFVIENIRGLWKLLLFFGTVTWAGTKMY